MKTEDRTLLLLRILITAFLLFGITLFSNAYAEPPLQRADPRPSDGGDGGGGGGGGAGDSGGDGGAAADSKCASLVGQVINWGAGGEGGITTELKTGSWQISTVSATDGNYGYGGLGVGVAVLHVSLTPEQAGRFQPLIQDAGVYLNCNFPIIANIALAGSDIEPPATIEASTSNTSVQPGEQVGLTLTINNGLPNEITNVVVTHLFPPGLMPVNVSAPVDPQAADILNAGADGWLVAVNLDKVATGAEVAINITATADEELPATTRLSSTATLFYRESVAHQASLDFTVGAGRLPTPIPAQATATTPALPTPAADALVLPTPEPQATATAAPTSTAAPEPTEETESGEDFVPPGGLPTTGDNFIPPPGLLPTTGQNSIFNIGWESLLPAGSVGLAIVVLVIYGVRASAKKD